MKNVTYSSTSLLSCAECGGDAVICVDAELTLVNQPFLTVTVVSVNEVIDSCGRRVYRHGLSYDEAQLADPTYNLVASDITGIFCKGCLVSYFDYFLSTYLTNLFRPTPNDLYVYVWPPGPPPFPPGDPMIVDVDSIVGNVVYLRWHSIAEP